MFQISRFAKNAAFIIAVTTAFLSLNYIARAVWSEPGNTPPTCPAGSPGCDAPINVSDTEQAKTGGLRLGSTGTAIANGEFAAYLFKDANNSNYFIDPANAGISAILNGNVGIGTSTPPDRLLKLYFNNNNSATGLFNVEQNGLGDAFMNFSLTGGVSYALGIDNSDADKFKIGYANSGPSGVGTGTLLTIDNSGNVGIGTSGPGEKLDVVGKIRASDNICTTAFGGKCLSDISGGVWTTSGTNIYNNNTGNVGVGTTTPDYKLDVNGSLKATNYVWKDGVNWSMPDANSEMSFDFASGDGTASWQVWDPIHGSILAVRNDDKVGIGTNTPSAKLEIRSSGTSPSSNGLYVYNTNIAAGEDSFITTRVAGSGAGDPIVSFDIAGEAGWSAGIDNSDSNKFKIGRNWDSLSTTTALTIDYDTRNIGIGTTNPAIKLAIGDSDTGLDWAGDGQLDLYSNNVNTLNVRSGNVGIGLTNPGMKLDVNGNVRADAFFYSSDERLKENITRIESPLAKILKLNGVVFNWKKSGEKSVGLTAQNVEKVFPELVKTDSAGMKSVEYGNLVAPLIEAIKEQQKMIESQQRQIDELKALIK